MKQYTNTVTMKYHFCLFLLTYRGRDRLAVGFITAYAINAFESHLWRGVLDTTLCDKDYQLLAADRWFSPGTPFPKPIKLTATI
jgi:hypothetical protein